MALTFTQQQYFQALAVALHRAMESLRKFEVVDLAPIETAVLEWNGNRAGATDYHCRLCKATTDKPYRAYIDRMVTPDGRLMESAGLLAEEELCENCWRQMGRPVPPPDTYGPQLPESEE